MQEDKRNHIIRKGTFKRPFYIKHTVRITGYVNYNDSLAPSIFAIATNGNVTISHGSGLTSHIGFTCTYSI